MGATVSPWMRIAVVGASGFIGRATAAALQAAGHAVVGLSRGRRARADGVEWRQVDVTRGGPALAEALAGCDAVVNLVGIKRTERAQGFAAAHVQSVRALVAAMGAAGIRRLVHVGVAGTVDDPRRPYMATKAAGEREVLSSGTDWTILRPGPVFGPGDDFVRNLAATLRHAGVFPAPAGGRALLQPVAVEDVAAAIVGALAQPAAIGATYDVVGPERLTLAAIVRRVAAALGLPVRLLPCPTPLLAAAVTLLERLPDPLLTRSQLGLLSEGLIGDPGPAARDLGLRPRALTEGAIRVLAADVGPWLGISLRLRRGDEDRFLGPCAKGLVQLAWLVPLALALIAGLGALTEHVWWRMFAANLVLVPLCLLLVPLPWRALWRPTAGGLAVGALAGLLLVGLGWLVCQALFAAAPELRPQVAGVYAWVTLLPPALAAPMLLAIAAGEEVVWRGAVAFTVAGRFGPWWGCAASAGAFALAHVSLGVPVLTFAALGAGFFWAWLGLKTRSLLAVWLSHVLWDACVALLRLY